MSTNKLIVWSANAKSSISQNKLDECHHSVLNVLHVPCPNILPIHDFEMTQGEKRKATWDRRLNYAYA